ncbi:hypothetical protein OPU71_18475 [Niveibacterium sp. 24ML]|uniref:hypothetical protein n=1 Tax=Niveibacterium sp. 24ML TaxID=2985512 RepID=UPI002271CAFC|nr:hypothetical protein [Niveibacterium sp. 24ML]MCX9158112.1 hypothetical protein [Niveibacterium sp. 24ML]
MISKLLDPIKALVGRQSAAPDSLSDATVEQLIDAFRAAPERFLNSMGHPAYPWPNAAPLDFPNMYFQYRGEAFGYAHGLHIEERDDVRTLVVGHFAIGEGRVARQGLGRRLAHWLRDEFKRRYGVTHIRFEEAEREKRPQDAAFFTALGAQALGKSGGNKQVYLWRVSTQTACVQT